MLHTTQRHSPFLQSTSACNIPYNIVYITLQVRWNARYPMLMSAEPGRWFASVLVHTNFMHIFSNTVLFLALSGYLERKFGCVRTAGASVP